MTLFAPELIYLGLLLAACGLNGAWIVWSARRRMRGSR